MKSEDLVWFVASQQTQHDYCNDCISHHCNYLLKLLLGTLIAIGSLIHFEKVEWWTSARSETVAVQGWWKVAAGGLRKDLPLARRAVWPLCVQSNDRAHVSSNYQEFQWRRWARCGDFLRGNRKWSFVFEEYLAKCLAPPPPTPTAHYKRSPLWRKVEIQLSSYCFLFLCKLFFNY